MSSEPPKRRANRRWGLGIGAFSGFVVAFMVQALFPVIAKVPGLLICGGDDLELVMRRRTSYGVCGGDAQDPVHYGTILVVSTLVWAVLCAPVGLLIARWIARKAENRPG